MNDSVADVFCLMDKDGKLLPPAVQATVLAKYSRSPDSAREIVKNLSEEEADKFQDKYFIAYNHSSIAELASIPICFEKVSIVATKFLEKYPRAAYSEKSTRYQKFSSDSFITPPGGPDTMKKFAARFYETYDELYPETLKRCAEFMGKNPEDPAVLSSSTVKARAFDNLRYLLPAGTGTNVAVVINGRDVRYMIREARGHHNQEFNWLAEKCFEAVSEICPVFVRNAKPDNFEPRMMSLGSLSPNFNRNSPSWYVEINRPHLLPKPELVTASFKAIVASKYSMSWSEFKAHMETRGERGVPDVFRSFRVGYEIMMDYGAWRDMQRHRRCDQSAEQLTTHYGYLVPDDLIGTPMEEKYRSTMESIDIFDDEKVIYDPELMQYMIPMGYLHRSNFEMDLAEVYYITELRTKSQGHISYRRVAWDMHMKAFNLYPELMQWCRAVRPDYIGEHR